MTQQTASIIFDLPHPLGPKIATKLLGTRTVVGSTKDLKPASLIFFNCISLCSSLLRVEMFNSILTALVKAWHSVPYTEIHAKLI